MEILINKLIDIDNMAKQIIGNEEEKENKLDEIMQKELNKEKAKITAKYNSKIKLKKESLDKTFLKEKEQIESSQKNEIDILKNNFNTFKKEKLKNLINEIIKIN